MWALCYKPHSKARKATLMWYERYMIAPSFIKATTFSSKTRLPCFFATKGLCNDGVTVQSVKIRYDGGRRKWRCETVISEFRDPLDGAWRYGGRYGLRIAKRPKNCKDLPQNDHWLFSPHFKILHVHLHKQTIGVIIKGKGKEKEQQKVCVLTRIRSLDSTFHNKKHLTMGL